MRNKKAITFSIVLVCVLLLSAVVIAETQGDWTYTVNNKKVTVTAYTGSDANVTIPKKIAGFPVTAIGIKAFTNCHNLNEVYIPDGVIEIGAYAFYGCGNLLNVRIPSSITTIDKRAFSHCENLRSLYLPDNVSVIGDDAFTASKKSHYAPLGSITAKALSKGSYNFIDENYNRLYLRYIFDDNNHIAGLRVIGCDKDASIVSFPENIVSIDTNAFYKCNKLRFVTIPNSVVSIGDYSFSTVNEIYVPESVKEIGRSAFSYSSTIYCHEFSEVDYWAKEHGYNHVVYVDQLHPNQYRSISLSASEITLARGKSMTIAAQAFPSFDSPEITWKTSNPSVATVNNGIVQIVGKGSATITASVDAASATVSVTGYIAPESFDLISEEWVLTKNTLQLEITNLTPSDADISPSWSSGDKGIATVDSNGLVTAKRPGEVMISVSGEGITRRCLVHVTYPVTAISFDEELVRVLSDETLQLTAHVTAREETFDNRMITMSSSDETIVTVDENFIIHPQKAGSTIITATAESGIQATVSCIVIDPCEVHTPVSYPGVLPTGDVPGYTGKSICSTCGKVLVDHRPISSVQTLLLPSSLRVIADFALTRCAADYIVIPNGASAIGSCAFADAPNLRFVTVPDSVNSIAPDAFEGCELLTFFCSDSSAAAAYAEEHGFAHTAP